MDNIPDGSTGGMACEGTAAEKSEGARLGDPEETVTIGSVKIDKTTELQSVTYLENVARMGCPSAWLG